MMSMHEIARDLRGAIEKATRKLCFAQGNWFGVDITKANRGIGTIVELITAGPLAPIGCDLDRPSDKHKKKGLGV
jgi:predicted dinucleotide-utilizing enzyme